jgi:hypothetical protein
VVSEPVAIAVVAVVAGCCSEQPTSNKANIDNVMLDNIDLVDMMVPPRDSGRTPDELTVAGQVGYIKESRRQFVPQRACQE